MVALNTNRGRLIMKAVHALPMALLLALTVPALAKNDKGNQGNGNGNGNGGNVRGAPGPLAGAGLPFLLIGGGIYWIVRRRKKTKLVS